MDWKFPLNSQKVKTACEWRTKMYGVWMLTNKKWWNAISSSMRGVISSIEIKGTKAKATYLCTGVEMGSLRDLTILKTSHRFYELYSWTKVLNFCRSYTFKAICLDLVPRIFRWRWLPVVREVQHLLYNLWATSCLRNISIRLIKIICLFV